MLIQISTEIPPQSKSRHNFIPITFKFRTISKQNGTVQIILHNLGIIVIQHYVSFRTGRPNIREKTFGAIVLRIKNAPKTSKTFLLFSLMFPPSPSLSPLYTSPRCLSSPKNTKEHHRLS